MNTQLIPFYHLLDNILTFLSYISSFISNISSFILDNSIYCTIFILVPITLVGIVLLADASTSAKLENILDTKQDFIKRSNDNRIPLNLGFVQYNGPGLMLIDHNDSYAVRMLGLFPNRTESFISDGARSGLRIKPQHVQINNDGELLVNASMHAFLAVSQVRAVQSRGLPIGRQPHHSIPDDVTVLKVQRSV
ncbi:MAG: hypothetical protein EOP34_09020 [Rickettsiales bacterium]|jgi:hypothetical protein|nr:MAG: hypothetical protein EOP34_09020 [Rickettsiales bacterium]